LTELFFKNQDGPVFWPTLYIFFSKHFLRRIMTDVLETFTHDVAWGPIKKLIWFP